MAAGVRGLRTYSDILLERRRAEEGGEYPRAGVIAGVARMHDIIALEVGRSDGTLYENLWEWTGGIAEGLLLVNACRDAVRGGVTQLWCSDDSTTKMLTRHGLPALTHKAIDAAAGDYGATLQREVVSSDRLIIQESKQLARGIERKEASAATLAFRMWLTVLATPKSVRVVPLEDRPRMWVDAQGRWHDNVKSELAHQKTRRDDDGDVHTWDEDMVPFDGDASV